MQAAYAPLIRGFTKVDGQPQGRRAAAIRPQRWGPQHIPAFLPEDWYRRHFELLTGVNPMFTRTAALRLVQMVTGGSLDDAARFLGIDAGHDTWLRNGRIYSGAWRVQASAKQQPDPLGFETALTRLAAELDEPARCLVNYQRRRRALESWSIDETTWSNVISGLLPAPGKQPELGDLKRQFASIYVWVQLTSGEHHFAPRPIQAAQPPEIQQVWKRDMGGLWHLMHSPRPRPHYIKLKAELHSLATTLTETIEQQVP